MTKHSSVICTNPLSAWQQLAGATVVAAVLLPTLVCGQSTVVFDNMSNFEGGNTNAHITSTGSTPNTYMGDGYVLAAGTTSITGFDLFPVNLSGNNYTSLKINLFVWDVVNTGTVGVGSPAFSGLLGSYSFTSSGTFNSGFYYPFEGSPAGSAPGIVLSTPIDITDTTIGFSVNYQGSTDGVNFTSINSFTSLITYGIAPTVGSQLFNGYFRNAASESDGNFTSALRSLSGGLTSQSLGVRVYGVNTVPEPTTLALSGLGALALIGWRRRK